MEIEKSNNLEKEKVIELAEGQLVDVKEVKKEKTISEITNRPESTNGKNGSGLLTNRKNGMFSETRGRERAKKEYFRSHLQKTILKTWRPVKVTKGGRRFSFTSLALIKDEEKKGVAYAHMGGKEPMKASAKAFRKAQKKLLNYFSTAPRTIPRDITVHYNATKLILKPTPPGSGIKASEMLATLCKYLEIKDVSIKIIGSRNKLNVMRAAFLAFDELTGKRYEY
ncbi:MAG: 30S ribosomal protein S5 [Mycoplasmataceae bacterium RV_VA103A]|nr:MAG: 30S ribosomal protein S5 [Mycoplasmataceae bacterium RV_VA103A]